MGYVASRYWPFFLSLRREPWRSRKLSRASGTLRGFRLRMVGCRLVLRTVRIPDHRDTVRHAERRAILSQVLRPASIEDLPHILPSARDFDVNCPSNRCALETSTCLFPGLLGLSCRLAVAFPSPVFAVDTRYALMIRFDGRAVLHGMALDRC